ncbi:MAG: glycosyltransferase family 2 protein [Methanomassiliicoccales archaeon]|nr:glycosyltransferase family 2 protein [Methanomassiliicoccales archaeon]NYT15999.1 glycosyltransferase family 2 protein [Methanomassiliicoccales archaeon]
METNSNSEAMDVIIPTWNSSDILDMVLEGVREHIHPNRIILVDRNSTDKTLDIAKEFDCDVLTDTVSLGSARMLGISSSSAEFVAFIDDDIVIHEDFREKLMEFMDNETGAVQGTALSTEPRLRRRMKDRWEKLTKEKGFFLLKPGQRGYTNCTILRRRLLSGLQIEDLNSFEDWVIANHILEEGYSWKITPVYVDHHHVVKSVVSKYGWNGAGIWNLAKTGRLSISKTLRYFTRYAATHPLDMVVDLRLDDRENFIYHFKALVGVMLSPLYTVKKFLRD